MSTRETATLRIAIHARSQEAADRFWQGLEKRLHKRAKLSAHRSGDDDANVTVHLLTQEDFADAEATGATIDRIVANVAATNILLEPLIADIQARQRMAETLADFARRPGYERLASQKDTEDASLARHARELAKVLAERFAAPGPVALEEDGRAEKTRDRPAKDGTDARKETRRQKNAKRNADSSSDLTSGTVASRSERKAQKHAKRNARKAQKKAAKGERRAGADTAVPVLAPEAGRFEKRARKRAEKDTRRATKTGAEKRAGAAVAKTPLGDADRSGRKAQKRVAKNDMKASKEEGGMRARKSPNAEREAEASVEASVVAPETRGVERTARKAENQRTGSDLKKTSKNGERRRRKDAPFEGEDGTIPAAKDDKSAEKAVTKAKKGQRAGSRRGHKHAEDDSGSLSIRIAGLNEKSLLGLRQALERKSPGVVLDAAEAKQKSDVAIYAFEDPLLDADAIGQCLGAIAKEEARARVFLDRLSSLEEDLQHINRAIAKLASACNGRVLRLSNKLNRYNDGFMMVGGRLTDAAYDLIADSILGIAASALSNPSPTPPAPPVSPDLAEARALADSGPEFLRQMRWNEAMAPKLIRTRSSKEAMEALVDEKLVFPSKAVLNLNAPIVWPDKIPDRAMGVQVLGLEFLTGPLAYWFSKAGGQSNHQISEIDTVLKERGIKASEILARAEKVMLDFTQKYPPGPASDAWQESAVSRRVRVFMLYVLCCKMAIARHIRFDTKAFATIFCALLELIERLRSDDFYKPTSFEGFQQDGLLIGLGLALRGSGYGDRLLVESLDRLRQLQLEPGLTADGVWRAGTFSDHCSLLAMLKILMGDFDKSDAALIEPFAAAAKKMTVFAEAMLKSNGHPPAFDGSRQKSYARELSGTRRALAQAGGKIVSKSKIETMPRLTETYVFRDAQYFISHSAQKISEDSSLVVLHADRPSILTGDPGGVTLAFAHGEADLLVRAEPGEVGRRDKSSLFDPALRNGYHVNGAGFDARGEFRPNAVRIVKSWRGPGWAAAKSIDEINPAATISRIAVHFKEAHVLLVVDGLESHDGKEATFEQCWHVAPGLTAPASYQMPLRFAAAGHSGMIVAFDGKNAIALEAEGEGTRIRRAARMAEGVMASLFQWTEESAPATVELMRDAPGGWTVTVSGPGFGGKLTLAGDELRFEKTD